MLSVQSAHPSAGGVRLCGLRTDADGGDQPLHPAVAERGGPPIRRDNQVEGGEVRAGGQSPDGGNWRRHRFDGARTEGRSSSTASTLESRHFLRATTDRCSFLPEPPIASLSTCLNFPLRLRPPTQTRLVLARSRRKGAGGRKSDVCRFGENGVQRPEFLRSSRHEVQTGARSVAFDSPPPRITTCVAKWKSQKQAALTSNLTRDAKVS